MKLRTSGAGLAPATEVLTAIWGRVLARGSVGVDDDFFASGGTWYDAARASWLAEDAFGVEVAAAEVAEASTPARLAALIRPRRIPDVGPPEEGGDWVAPVAVAQEGMLWHEQLVPGSFNLAPLVRRHRGTLDRGALGAAFDELMWRHEPLRTSFTVRRGRPVQIIRPPTDAGLPVVDLTGLDMANAEEEARRIIGEDGSRPFDLASEPLFQPRLLHLATDDHVLIVRVHHTIFDDWSVGVYRHELSSLYSVLLSGQRPSLPELPVGYTEFARRQRRQLAGPQGAADMAWWREQLAGAPLTTQVDIGDPGGVRRAGPSRPVVLPLSPALTKQLRALARHGRSTLYMTLLAGFQLLLHRRTGSDDLLVATVVANRNDVQLEKLIGCFTKKVPLRLRLQGDPTFLELVGQVRERLLGVMAHQDLGFETILGEALGDQAAAHGLVPHVPIMFQGLAAPRSRLTLPGLEPSGFDTAASQGPGLHVVSPPRAPAEWGGGLYPGTFLGLSVVDHGDDVQLLVQGGFHPPTVEALLDEYEAILTQAVARPLESVGALIGARAGGPARFRGFPLDLHQMEKLVASCPGAQEATIRRHVPVPAPGRRSNGTGVADPRLVANLDTDIIEAPTLRQLRRFLWSGSPGSIWPAELRGKGETPVDAAAPDLPSDGEEAFLASAWATVLAIPSVVPTANYWQSFSFLAAVTAANDQGAGITLEQVGRNRTVDTLAVDLAIARASRPAPPETVPVNPVLATPTTTGDVIRAEGLSKTYPSGLMAVDGVDLSVREGEIFGLLGPNGAGKTTTVGMLTTLIIPTAGRAFVAGVDVVTDPSLAKQYLGVVPQANNLDNNLTVLENLYFHGRYFGMGSRRARVAAEEMLERFRLTGRGRDRVTHLSGGMVRRLQVARALMQGPAVVFLDEPTAGLDPQSRLALWEILTDLRTGGQTILVTTHYMEEADQFCDRVAIMDHGRILALDTPGHLKRSLGSGGAMLIKGDGDLQAFVRNLEALEWVHGATPGDGTVRVTLSLVDGAMSTVMATAEQTGVKVADVSMSEDSLETVFINLTGRELRE